MPPNQALQADGNLRLRSGPAAERQYRYPTFRDEHESRVHLACPACDHVLTRWEQGRMYPFWRGIQARPCGSCERRQGGIGLFIDNFELERGSFVRAQ